MFFFLLVNKARYIEDKVLYRKNMIHLNLVFFFFPLCTSRFFLYRVNWKVDPRRERRWMGTKVAEVKS